jgi:hypothetical protein
MIRSSSRSERSSRGEAKVSPIPSAGAVARSGTSRIVDEEAADQRADHRRDPEHTTEQALVAAAVARRHEVADDRHGRHEQSASPQPLQRAEDDQLGHVLREAAERGADQEQDDRDLQHELAAVEVAELPVQRRRDRRREQVRGDDPGEVRDAAEVADDGRQCRRHDRLVERREQQHEEQRREDQAHAWLLHDCGGLAHARIRERPAHIASEPARETPGDRRARRR